MGGSSHSFLDCPSLLPCPDFELGLHKSRLFRFMERVEGRSDEAATNTFAI